MKPLRLRIDMEDAQDVACIRCGSPGKDHYAVNYSDGNLIGGTVMVCPIATYFPSPAKAEQVKVK